jgi:polysaccharide export outer membrane protein
MARPGMAAVIALWAALLGACAANSGCHNTAVHDTMTGGTQRGQGGDPERPVPPAPQYGPPCCDQDEETCDICVPTELCKVSLPPYRLEPPDILVIDTLRMIPLPPYRIEPMDVLVVNVAQALPNQPISGTYGVTPDGLLNLGFAYGAVRVAGMTLEEAETALRNLLKKTLNDPQISVALGQIRAVQQTRGEHLIGPDGTISLGTYGDVYVAGMTRGQAKCAIEQHLSQFLLNPQISLAVYAYNSKVYYVITDGAGYGQQIYRFPATGNETVLDAISNIAGLPAQASRKKIWVARPAPPCHPCDQILPVDWLAIVEGGSTKTNYQIFPGDRIYVKADWLITFDNTLAKILSPIERLLGITLLGSSTVNSIRSGNNNNGAFTPLVVP